jgi:hypothetical protein
MPLENMVGQMLRETGQDRSRRMDVVQEVQRRLGCVGNDCVRP